MRQILRIRLRPKTPTKHHSLKTLSAISSHGLITWIGLIEAGFGRPSLGQTVTKKQDLYIADAQEYKIKNVFTRIRIAELRKRDVVDFELATKNRTKRHHYQILINIYCCLCWN